MPWHKYMSCVARAFQYRGAQFVSGALLALGFAPYHYLVPALLALAVFYHGQITAASLRSACVRAFWFGYGFSIAAHYWIAFSLLVDVQQFGWLVPFCVLGLSAAMACWWVAFAALFATLKSPAMLSNALIFTSVFVLIEYARSFGIFGFPWNLIGYALMDVLPLAQLASVAGVYGVGALVVLAVTLCYHVRGNPRPAIGMMILVFAIYGWGAQRLQTPLKYADTNVRIVQPNIAQAAKWNPQVAAQTMATLQTLSRSGGAGRVDMIVWPETAVPFTLNPDMNWGALQENVPPDTSLITGFVRMDDAGNLFNSVAWIHGNSAQIYDKKQLVPFGEFVPFRDILPIDKITPGGIDFSRGKGGATLQHGGVMLQPLVCYESIFPQLSLATKHRPQALVNVTNDGWFGDSPGPHQHLDMARMRAIEQGLPMLRAANTGVSAVVSPYGALLVYLPLNRAGVLDHVVPKALAPTLYSRYGAWGACFYAVVLLFVFVATYRRKR